MKILVVDDEYEELQLYKAYLHGTGIEAELFTSAANALGALRDHGTEFSLAVVDLMMPEMSGLEFMVIAHKIMPTMPFIVMSCLTQHQAKVDAIAAGAALYVEKPASVAEFRKLLQHVSNKVS